MLAAGTLSAQQYNEITLQEYLYGYYHQRSIYGVQPMKDGESYTTLSANKIIRYSYKTGEVMDTVANFNAGMFANTYPFFGVNGHEFSDDESKILFHTIQKPLYRHSFFAFYAVYDRNTKTVKPLDSNGNLQRKASLSSDGSMAAYIRDNNITRILWNGCIDFWSGQLYNPAD